MFSGGAGSAWLAEYVADRYGAANTVLLHTDTRWEDEDNYRFMREVSEYVGVPITFHNDGRTPADIFRDELYFGNFGTAPCSKRLKMAMTFDYIQRLFGEGVQPILYFGIDYGEARRAPRIAFNYKHNVDVFEDGLEVRFPLIGEIDGVAVNGEQLLYGTDYLRDGVLPRMYNDMVYESLAQQAFVQCVAEPKTEIEREWGISLPRMYALGFSHANCGGRCVKAGKRHYANLYHVWPERYAEMEQLEREINEAQLAKRGRHYTILSRSVKQPDGTRKTVPYSLADYRVTELEGAGQADCDVDDGGEPCGCVI